MGVGFAAAEDQVAGAEHFDVLGEVAFGGGEGGAVGGEVVVGGWLGRLRGLLRR
jgi:hypothetical protein